MKVKVCGMRDACNIKELASLSPDYMGFIFYPKSPRYVAAMPEEIIGYLKERGIEPVALFVDEPFEKVVETIGRYGFDTVQLHGSENAEYCDALRCKGIRVLKAVSVGEKGDIARCRSYDGHADILVIDNKCRSKGGSGKKFDWSLLEGIDCETPFLLSGGIGPDDADAVREIYDTMGGRMLGVDVNSCFETAPAVKDTAALERFIKQL